MEIKKDNNAHSRGYEMKNSALIFGSNNYLGPFVNNESIVIVKRTERVVTALYLVTECQNPDEPLRVKIRSTALLLMSLCHKLLGVAGMNKFESEGDIVLALIEIRSYIALGLSVSLVSSMNGTILISEINALIQDIEALKLARVGEFGGMRNHMRHKEISITKEMFDVGTGEIFDKNISPVHTEDMSFKVEKSKNEDTKHKGHSEIQYHSKGQEGYSRAQTRPLVVSKNQPHESGTAKSDIAIRLGRRNTILKLIKDKKEVTIKDVSSVVPDVSEKTIQRELLNLVSEGVLKKTGEKRWSRYSLKT